MPLTLPNLDDRRYQDLVDEALARIPVHNPEWTNFNRSDPGVTLIELFAFLTETLLYRANQIPERNRRKFLQLLGVPLRAATPARGLVSFALRAGTEGSTIRGGSEVFAGNLPFRLESGLDVLPVEAQIYYKRPRAANPAEAMAYYRQLYASALAENPAANLTLYDTVPMSDDTARGVDLASDSVDGSLWVALLCRPQEKPADVRRAIEKKVLSLGVVPWLNDTGQQLRPTGRRDLSSQALLQISLPSGDLGTARQPRYRPLTVSASADVLTEPGILQITLPDQSALTPWQDVDPLEAGLDQFPPPLPESKLEARLVTWLRIESPSGARSRILWTGINAAMVSQRAHIAGEILPTGTGGPDQECQLAKHPVLPGTVSLRVRAGSDTTEWREIDDLLAAPPEVPSPDLRLPPGSAQAVAGDPHVFALDAEAGTLRFGDGLRGRRPASGAEMRASYDYSAGAAGNLGAGAINSAGLLQTVASVTNPVRTWGGSHAESTPEGEKQITRFLQHRERLVTAEDFVTITRRTPGVEIGRVEVLPAFSPELGSNQPGDAAGAVTLMLIPQSDPNQPDAPMPDRQFLNAVCAYLDPRRLVTTEVFLRGPVYRPVWASAGITINAGESVAEVRERVRTAVTDFLSPFRWPLRKPVLQAELVAVVSRVPGIQLVNALLLASANGHPQTQLAISGLELPRLLGLGVAEGDAPDLDALRGQAPAAVNRSILPIPAIPEAC